MSEEYDVYENDYDAMLEDDLFAIQEEYRRKCLIESLLGPMISTIAHVMVIVILAIVITDELIEPVVDLVITMEDLQPLELEEPPEVEKPDPIELQQPTDDTSPILTTVEETQPDEVLEDVTDDIPNIVDEPSSDVIVSASAFVSHAVYSGGSAGRASRLAKFGGRGGSQASLMKALRWLAKVQNPDGSWGQKANAGLTGLALLSFLAHDETPASREFGPTVKKAIMWLVNDPIEVEVYEGYCHAIKSYALAEAYGRLGISILEGKMNECIRIVIDGQQPGGSYDYCYNKDEEDQDLSLAGWNYQALKAAKIARCEEPGLKNAINKGVNWLKKQAARNTFKYKTQNNIPEGVGGKGRNTMRAIGTLCLQALGEGDTPEIKDELMAISKIDFSQLSAKNLPHGSLYCWYYATQAMFNAGGDFWAPWSNRFQRVLSALQHEDGYWLYGGRYGSTGNPLGELSVKIYATTLCALQLTVFYRYSPSSKGGIGGKSQEAAKERADLFEEEGLDLLE
jgi:hypothetical protein